MYRIWGRFKKIREEWVKVGKKINDPEVVEKLAILIAEKMGSDDKVDVFANKVIDDYFAAKKIIKAYKQGPSKEKQAKIPKREEKKVQNASRRVIPIKTEAEIACESTVSKKPVTHLR